MTAAVLGAVLIALAALCWPSRQELRGRAALEGGSSRGHERPGHEGPGRGEGPQQPASATDASLLDDSMSAGRSLHRTLRHLLARGGATLRRTPEDAVLLSFLDAAAAALRAGLPVVEALTVAAETVPAHRAGLVAPVLEAASEGRSVAAAWQRQNRRHPHPDLAGITRAWALSERTGAPLAEALTTAAALSRARAAHRQRVAAATAGARSTALVLTLLPLGGVVLAVMLGVGPAELYGSPAGAVSLGLGLLFLVAGRWVVRRMVARVEGGSG